MNFLEEELYEGITLLGEAEEALGDLYPMPDLKA